MVTVFTGNLSQTNVFGGTGNVTVPVAAGQVGMIVASRSGGILGPPTFTVNGVSFSAAGVGSTTGPGTLSVVDLSGGGFGTLTWAYVIASQVDINAL